MDLIAFVEARLTDDEQAARDVDQIGRWFIGGDGEVLEDGYGLVATGRWGGVGVAGVHIVRHDPARVLRDVAAKRRVLARHTLENRWTGECCCRSCSTPSVGAWAPWPCPELLDMASVWSDHEAYRSEWSP